MRQQADIFREWFARWKTLLRLLVSSMCFGNVEELFKFTYYSWLFCLNIFCKFVEKTFSLYFIAFYKYDDYILIIIWPYLYIIMSRLNCLYVISCWLLQKNIKLKICSFVTCMLYVTFFLKLILCDVPFKINF